jgi:DNA-binding transcriptional regulator YiaG
MNPAEIKAARKRLGLSQAELAETLRMGANGGRTVRRWELGEVAVTGPASVAIELLLARSKAQSDANPVADKDKTDV